MANYYDWNQAIYHYITDGLPLGSRIFLSIDDDALIGAGRFLNPAPPREQRIEDFIRAIRARYVSKDSVRNFSPIGDEFNKVPPYLSFLAATVLAAYRMGENEEVSSTNYFTRLNQVLGYPSKHGRPEGLEAGIEDILWQHWANWLTQKGYLPSARPGVGSQKYVSYPISQTLLREADKEHLWHHFTNRKWPLNLDENIVSARVWQDRHHLVRHLTHLLEEKVDSARQEGLHQAIYDVYDLWASSESRSTYKMTSATGGVRNLSAGLYRTFNYIYGEPEYAILPQQPRRVRVEHAQVFYEGQHYPLILERPGWYRPLWDVTAQTLNNGLEIEVEGAEELHKLVLPTRDFWILTPDPNEPDSGIYASWGKPSLGTSSIILCKESLQSQLNHLKAEGFINWRDDPIPIWNDKTWLEYRDVMVVSEGWGGVSLENDDLLQSLKPKSLLGVSFEGGIRVRQDGGWLVGYGPEITIHSFYSEANLTLIDPSSNENIFIRENLKTDSSLYIDWPKKASIYILRITSGANAPLERSFALVDWDKLSPAIIEDYPKVSIGVGTISGALVEKESFV